MFWGIEKYGGKPSWLINKGITQETNNFFVIDQKGFSLKDYLSNLTQLFKNNILFNLNWIWFLFVSYIIWCCSLLEVVYLLVYKVLILYLYTLIILILRLEYWELSGWVFQSAVDIMIEFCRILGWLRAFIYLFFLNNILGYFSFCCVEFWK